MECVLIAVAQSKLASDVTTQVDFTADGEYTAALHLTVCTL